MSRHHAKLVQQEGRWWVADLGTTNGTSLNDKRIDAPVLLRRGDRLSLGTTTIVFDDPEPSWSQEEATTVGSVDPADDETKQTARMRTLNEFHRALATPISRAELFDLILAKCFDVLGPEEGVILIVDSVGHFAPVAGRGDPDRPAMSSCRSESSTKSRARESRRWSWTWRSTTASPARTR